MFTCKGLFSEILCPHNETCVLPNCIFKHADSKSTSAMPPPQIQDNLTSGNDQEGQRKRTKLNDENERPGSLRNANVPTSRPQVTSKPSLLAEKRTSTATRAISPPPLRRKIGLALTVAPKPNLSLAKIEPSVIPKAGPKVPVKEESLNPRALKNAPAKHDMRLRLVRALHEHFVRLNGELAKDAKDTEEELILSDQQLIIKALDIEEHAAGSPAIYSNLVKNKILYYKKMSIKDWVDERVKEVAAEKAKATPVVAKLSAPAVPAEPVSLETGLTPEQELMLLPRLYTPITHLSAHGYVSKIPTPADIEQAKAGVEAAKGWEVCDRCKSRFQVFPGRREEDGALTSGGKCVHHYGKPYFEDKNPLDPKAKRQKRYRCCNEPMGDSAGCTVVEDHVFKISEVKRMASVLNFEQTPENPARENSAPVCIDGEMGYTVYGLELIRLTATSWPHGKELFDVLVRPVGPILDLNSRYSGVWPEDMAKAPAWSRSNPKAMFTEGGKRLLQIVDSPAKARSLLFSFLSPKTPLIGHGLENDLNATRLIHPTIIDTALLYPHKAGLPFRMGLKALMAQHLNRQIQVVNEGVMEGHDSKEDANAAGDLVKFALGNEWKKMMREGWKLEGGKFKHAGGKELVGSKADALKALISGGAGAKRSREEMEKQERLSKDW